MSFVERCGAVTIRAHCGDDWRTRILGNIAFGLVSLKCLYRRDDSASSILTRSCFDVSDSLESTITAMLHYDKMNKIKIVGVYANGKTLWKLKTKKRAVKKKG